MFSKELSDLQHEEELLDKKLQDLKLKEKSQKERVLLEKRIAEKKSKLKDLLLLVCTCKFHRIKRKTSPALRSIEKKLVIGIPKLLKSLGEGSSSIMKDLEKESKQKDTKRWKL